MTTPIPCPYCGQIIMCKLPEDKELNESEQSELALSQCGCTMGNTYRAREGLILDAQYNIETLCFSGAEENSMTPIESEAVHEILDKSAELVAKGVIFELTVKVSAGGTVKISAGSTGTIKVKRTVGFSEQLEANQKY